MLGPIANIERVTSVYACQELEEYGRGNAGTIGNIMNTGYIPLTVLFSYLLFGEKMSVLATIGGALVAAAILIVAGVKAAKHVCRDEGNGNNEEESEKLID